MRQILFVTCTYYLPDTISGEIRSMNALCNRLKAGGYDPIVVCGRDSSPVPATPPPDLGYTVLRLREPVAAMLEIMDRLSIGSVVLYGAGAAAAAAALPAARARRLRLFLTAVTHRYTAPPPSETPQWRYAANSRFLADYASALFGVPVARVPSLIEPDDYRCEPTGDAILFVNPTAPKGVHLAAEIARRMPHWRFLFVRSWPDAGELPHVEVSLPNVETRDSTHDMRDIYARTRLVLVPSVLEEGWGRVVSEAQVSGIPALASDRGGLKENVGPGGVVLPLDEPVEHWCAAIDAMLGNPERYAALSAAARRHAARAEVDPRDVAARFIDFLDS